MPDITANIIFYNDAELLEKCCLTLKAVDIPIIAIDGKYKKFPGRGYRSTDGSIDVAKKFADVYIEADKSFLECQADKRTRYLRENKPGDYALVIDTDEEYAAGKPDMRNLKEDIYSVAFYEPGVSVPMRPRLFKVYDDLIYCGRHWYLYRKSKMNMDAIEICKQCTRPKNACYDCANKIKSLYGCLSKQYEPSILKDINGNYVLIKHYPLRRPKKRQEQDRIYFKRRKEIQLNNFLEKPVINFSDDRIIRFTYAGDREIKDPVYGAIYNGREVSTTYGHYERLANYYGHKNFNIIDVNGLKKDHEQVEAGNKLIEKLKREKRY